MKNKENEQNKSKIPDQETFLKIPFNVKRCKDLDWEERVILSNYISYLVKGNEFYQTDSYQGRELGLSSAQISKYSNRLKERGEISTKMEFEENPNGGRPIPVRYVKVVDINKWLKGDTIPVVKKIISASKKRLAKKMAELIAINESGSTKEIMVVTTIAESPIEQPYSTNEQIVSKDANQQTKAVKSKKNDLPVGFKKELDRNKDESDEVYTNRRKYYSDMAILSEKQNPTPSDFVEFAKGVNSTDVFDEKLLPIMWNRMSLPEQGRVSKDVLTKIKQYME
ncbi:MAG: hypothetical protein IPP64_06715 [Bacteroidetes bacterium]|nr:hypothetical protein [Bacteroidota bacterium]